jgi:hypothetical protein
MDAVARNLNNNYVTTTWSGNYAIVPWGTLAWGTWHYVKHQGQLDNTYFYAETTGMSTWGNSWVTSAPTNATGIAENPTWGFLYNGLINDDAVVIGWTSASGQGHYMTLTAINFDSSTGAATITYLDPKDARLYNVPIYGNSDGTIGFFYSNPTHPWYTGPVDVKMALVFGPTPLSSMDPPGVPPLPTVPEPTTILPAEGTIGTEISIAGSGFGTKKGKVLIGSTPLTIIDWADGLIHCRLTKALDPRVYDMTIQPSEPKGTLPIIEKDAFVVRSVEIYSIEQGEGTAYDQVTIKGKFFGAKKGKVYLEYEDGGNIVRKSCKVTKWWMDPVTNESEIFFIVPKMLPEVCDVVVDPASPLPDAEDEGGFTVEAPEIQSVNPGSGSEGEQITILGNYFGSKKPKVYLGYVSNGKPVKKSCSIVSWGDDEILFTVPELPLGTYDVIVTNSVSWVTLSGGFIIK